MDDRALRVLEFDKIRDRLCALAATVRGRELCAELRPSSAPELVRRRQAETSEARAQSSSGAGLPLGGIRDLRSSLSRAKLGSTLQPGDLLDVADTCYGVTRLRRHLHERSGAAPLLWDIASAIGEHRDLEDHIRAAIDDQGEVKDDASAELQRVRKAMRTAEGRIRDRLEALVRSADAHRVLQDPIITVRGDRYVVPVKQEYRSQVPGVVHDVSGSGATLFVEPMAVVELNNELRQLAGQEEEEVQRILAELTGRVGREAESLETSCAAAAEIDAIAARARLSIDLHAVEPELNADGRIEIRRGRHPLLSGDVVPLDVHLGRDFDTLVITGPNTGGKTVALKAMGLFQLMAQAGLHVPGAAGTELSIFAGVHADIGDEQSIEQSLSTFSSHMKNIVAILAAVEVAPAAAPPGCYPGCLVFLDEVGAGTDPTEGAALATAILDHLHGRGARTAVTTHYGRLKSFASSRPRVANASVEFDSDTLRPTFRLILGMPGRSNAFYIAARLGLPSAIVEQARASLKPEEVAVERLLEEVEETRREVERSRQDAETQQGAALELRRQYEARLADFERQKHQTIERAREQAREVVAAAKREAEAVVRELREARAARREEEAIQAARTRLEEARRQLAEPERPRSPDDIPTDLKVGEAVEIVSLGQTGRALTAPGPDGGVLVQAGVLRVQAKLADLRRVEEDHVHVAAAARTGAVGGRSTASARAADSLLRHIGAQKAQTAPLECDLRGMTVDEALAAADKFIDDAVLAGLPQVRLIHGKGTGALRQAIGEWLRNHPHVAGHRLGGAGEGGDGVTIATLG